MKEALSAAPVMTMARPAAAPSFGRVGPAMGPSVREGAIPSFSGLKVREISNPFRQPIPMPTIKPGLQIREMRLPEAMRQPAPEPIRSIPVAEKPLVHPAIVFPRAEHIRIAVPKMESRIRPAEAVQLGFAQPILSPQWETEKKLQVVRQTIHGFTTEAGQKPELFEPVTPDHPVKPKAEEEEVEEKIAEDIKKKETTPIKDEKKVEIKKRRLVVDKEALARVLFQVDVALRMAFRKVFKKDQEEKEGVSGSEVRTYMPEEVSDKQVRSGSLKEDVSDEVPDGSAVLRGAGIKAIPKTTSEAEMLKRVIEVVLKNVPTARAKEGEIVTAEIRDKVYQFTSIKPPLVEESRAF